MPTAVAINVAANTSLPGVRGPIYPDGRFLYVPIPEREPTVDGVSTYTALGLDDALPVALPDPGQRVHFDPEFAGYFGRERYTYGDEHGVKAGPLGRLTPGDSLVFYATLSCHPFPDEPARTTHGSTADRGERVDWRPPDWGAFVVGEFRVADVLADDDLAPLRAGADDTTGDRDAPASGDDTDGGDGAVSGEDTGRADDTGNTDVSGSGETTDVGARLPSWAASNAHARRETFDAKVLVRGSDDSRLFDRAVPLSQPMGGADANRLVTELSNDSGKGPWWRRVLRFDVDATRRLRTAFDHPLDEWDDRVFGDE